MWDSREESRFQLVLDRDRSKLLRESSEFNFLDIKDQLSSVLEYTQEIHDDYNFWSQLPEVKKRSILGAFEDMINQLDLMEEFDPRRNDAWSMRNEIIEGFQHRYNDFYSQVIEPFRSWLGKKAHSQELTSHFGEQAKGELSEIKRVKKEIEKIQIEVTNAAAIAANVTSTAYAISFSKQAEQHKKNAKLWLLATGIVTILVAIIIVPFVIEAILSIRDTTAYKSSLETYILKALILGFLYFTLRFTIKNYSTNQHLYVVNQQRANALQSMEAFREAASDDSTKNTLLLAAVEAAYAHQETGFITTREGAGSSDSEIVNIVKTMTRR